MKISLTSLLSTAVTIVSVTGEEKRYIIKYKDVVDVGADIDMLAVETGIAAISTATEVHQVLAPQNAIAGTYSDKAIEKLRNDPNIEYIEDDIIASIAVDDDTDYYSLSYLRSSNNGSGGGGGDRRLQGSQTIPYGIPLVQADQVVNLRNEGCVKKICVVDSGYDKGHVDLPSGDDITGFSAVGSDFPYDGNLLSSHGTHVAGTVAALNNEFGVVGVLNGSPLHNVRVFRQGSGSIANVVAGFNDCVRVEADVINMSLGSSGNSATFRNAVRQAYDKGILLVAAAGNQGSTNFFYPASYPEVISVTGVDENENHFGRSNRNSQSEIAAPAVGVNSTINNNRYGLKTGTSMASPHVAGAAAMIWSHFPRCTNREISDALKFSAKDLGRDGKDPLFGFGLLQVKDALDFLRANPCRNPDPCISVPPTTPNPTPTPPPIGVPPTLPPVTTPPTTSQPTNVPTGNPTRVPTGVPTSQPTGPTNPPTSNPTGVPTNQPTNFPTRAPVPTNQPTNSPTRAPVPTQSSRVIAVNDVFDIGCFFYPDRPWLAECSIKSTNEEASAGKGVPVMDNDSASPVRRPLRIDLVTSTQDDDNIHGLCTIAGDRQTVVYTPGRNRAKATKICTYQVCTDDDGPKRCDTAQVTINMEEFTVIEV